MLLDKQIPVSDALRKHTHQKLSTFIFIGREEHWPEALSHRLAFERIPAPKSVAHSPAPIRLDLTQSALAAAESPGRALETSVCGVHSQADAMALVAHLAGLNRPVVY